MKQCLFVGLLLFVSQVTVAEPYTVNPGDVLQVFVWNEEELSRETLVRPDGMISFPMIGDVQAIGSTPTELATRIESDEVTLIDVRSDEEWKAGHIPQAEHQFLGRLPETMAKLTHEKPIVAQCQSGARSAIAASLLQAAGLNVINLSGGFSAWSAAGLHVDQSNAITCESGSKQCA